MLDFTTTLALMITGAGAWAWWNAGREAAESAAALGRDACRAAGVIWLDHSVHAEGWRLRRRHDGWLGVQRSFRFDYSEDGIDRHAGRLVLFEDRLVSFSGPRRRSADDPAALDAVPRRPRIGHDGF